MASAAVAIPHRSMCSDYEAARQARILANNKILQVCCSWMRHAVSVLAVLRLIVSNLRRGRWAQLGKLSERTRWSSALRTTAGIGVRRSRQRRSLSPGRRIGPCLAWWSRDVLGIRREVTASLRNSTSSPDKLYDIQEIGVSQAAADVKQLHSQASTRSTPQARRKPRAPPSTDRRESARVKGKTVDYSEQLDDSYGAERCGFGQADCKVCAANTCSNMIVVVQRPQHHSHSATPCAAGARQGSMRAREQGSSASMTTLQCKRAWTLALSSTSSTCQPGSKALSTRARASASSYATRCSDLGSTCTALRWPVVNISSQRFTSQDRHCMCREAKCTTASSASRATGAARRRWSRWSHAPHQRAAAAACPSASAASACRIATARTTRRLATAATGCARPAAAAAVPAARPAAIAAPAGAPATPPVTSQLTWSAS